MSFLSGDWPKSFEPGYDHAGMDVLFLMSSARDMGLDDSDIPALRAFVADPSFDQAWERFNSHWEVIDWEAREAHSAGDAYYGPPPDDGVDDMERTLPNPDDRRLHRLIRTDPEAGWADLRARLCASPPRDEAFLYCLVEDLMFNNPDAFIDRIEALIADCPQAREPVAIAHVGGRAATPGLERFWSLQEQMARSD